jgi:hypothetical protein
MPRRSPEEAQAAYEELVERFAREPSVTVPSSRKAAGFGASALKVDGKIFAMLSDGDLVVKLARRRVDELVASGIGKPFDAGRGRVMKEWVAIPPDHGGEWTGLAEEARRFVAGASGPS